MQERQERMEPLEVMMDGGRAQPLLEVGKVSPEQGGIHVTEITLAQPPLKTPQDVPVDGEGLAGPAFDPGSQLEGLPSLGEG